MNSSLFLASDQFNLLSIVFDNNWCSFYLFSGFSVAVQQKTRFVYHIWRGNIEAGSSQRLPNDQLDIFSTAEELWNYVLRHRDCYYLRNKTQSETFTISQWLTYTNPYKSPSPTPSRRTIDFSGDLSYVSAKLIAFFKAQSRVTSRIQNLNSPRQASQNFNFFVKIFKYIPPTHPRRSSPKSPQSPSRLAKNDV